MPIRTVLGTIEYAPVLAYYNTHKKEGDAPLERLDRAEGGFYIQKEEIDATDSIQLCKNDTIRQVRWSKRCLIQYLNYDPLTSEEQELLLAALQHVLGPDNVFLDS